MHQILFQFPFFSGGDTPRPPALGALPPDPRGGRGGEGGERARRGKREGMERGRRGKRRNGEVCVIAAGGIDAPAAVFSYLAAHCKIFLAARVDLRDERILTVGNTDQDIFPLSPLASSAAPSQLRVLRSHKRGTAFLTKN